MIAITFKVNCLLIFWCIQCVTCIVDTVSEGQRTVDDFIRQLTLLFKENSIDAYSPKYREKDFTSNYLNVVNQHFANLLENNSSNTDLNYSHQNNPEFGFRPQSQQRPPYYVPNQYPAGGNNGLGLPYTEPGPYPNRPSFGSFPLRPSGYPPPPGAQVNYRPPFGVYPQTSFIGALNSIAKYDDLRCVPRLLCEITSGGRNSIYGTHKNRKESSSSSLISRDVVTTLLTALNFVDDSPLLMFARAAFLGYTSKGDIGACLTAYPTCPRDPDQLVYYLNNHNGGFFRFFNQQLQQQQQFQHQQFAQNYGNAFKLSNRLNQNNHRFSVAKQGTNSRILNDPIDIEYVSSKVTYPAFKQRPHKVIFQSGEQHDEQPQESADNFHNSAFLTRKGKKLVFPNHQEIYASKPTMIFPDRTGTGNLILNSDITGHYKIVFADEDLINRKSKKIKFQPDSKMKFPDNK